MENIMLNILLNARNKSLEAARAAKQAREESRYARLIVFLLNFRKN